MKKILTILLFVLLLACSNTKSQKKILLAPATPSSIPLILMCNNIDNLQIELFTNHTQAHAKFLRGDADFIATGFTVGYNFYKQQKKVKVINSWVQDLTYLVSTQKNIKTINQLKNKEVYLPFKNSPIEKTFDAIAKTNGLSLSADFIKHYLPFTSMLQLLKQGKIKNAIMPEPFISKALQSKNLFLGFSLQKQYKQVFNNCFAPQIALFAYDKNINLASKINAKLKNAINYVNNNPKKAINKTFTYFKFDKNILLASLQKTKFKSIEGKKLQKSVNKYLKVIGEKNVPNKDFYIIN